nr:dihydrofolate reductase family protein [Roseburia sp. 1XD42-34]
MNVEQNRNVVLFIAASLDGYIATKDDSLEWLFQVDGEGDNGFAAFYETVDIVLMGKRTYDWIMEQEFQEFPYKNKQTYVFTRSPVTDTENVKFVSDNVSSFIQHLKQQKGKDIWIVGGGELLHPFLQEKLLDELIITVAPAILGDGIPLFKKGNYQLDLSLKKTKRFNQFVELHYEVKR